MSLLSVKNVGVRFGGVVALDELTFDVEAGTICALIGPNGAGKTTLVQRAQPALPAEQRHA